MLHNWRLTLSLLTLALFLSALLYLIGAILPHPDYRTELQGEPVEPFLSLVMEEACQTLNRANAAASSKTDTGLACLCEAHNEPGVEQLCGSYMIMQGKASKCKNASKQPGNIHLLHAARTSNAGIETNGHGIAGKHLR